MKKFIRTLVPGDLIYLNEEFNIYTNKRSGEPVVFIKYNEKKGNYLYGRVSFFNGGYAQNYFVEKCSLSLDAIDIDKTIENLNRISCTPPPGKPVLPKI